MTSEQLPPLPEPFMELHREIAPHVYAAWAEQMRAYAAAALAQEREVCAREAGLILQGFRVEWPIIEEVIRAIRAQGQHDPKVTHLNAWARDRLARHGIQLPDEDDHDGNPSF